ncbi:MAG: hypothetical protein RI949_2839 [Pseudomonadota bacterium]|jgi:mRNA interferase MazF
MRGCLVTVANQGDFGKPRPALVIQSDLFSELPSVTVLPLSSTLVDAPLVRVTLQPSTTNRLRAVSQVMVDKATTVLRSRLGPVFGQVDDQVMVQVDRSLAVFVGIAK